MRSPIPDYLAEMLGLVRPHDSGERADYIATLAEAEPEHLATAFATVDGQVYEAGDTSVEFSIQSISKPFAYALALSEHGREHVLGKVGVEPSGEAFNEISVDADGRPLNPMINAGAITVHSLVGGVGVSSVAREETVVDGLSAFAGRELRVDARLASDELGSAHRNLGIGYLLRSKNVLEEDPARVVEGYIRQCSVMVTVRDLAVMAATLANGGVNPLTGRRIVSGAVVRQVLSVMATCGMYDAAGDWFTQIGIPAKSGVSGGIIGTLPAQLGIATFSPRLDIHGNSVRGVQLFDRFSADMGLHLREVAAPSRSVLSGVTVTGAGQSAVRILGLQGSLGFAGAERVVREVASGSCGERRIALDLTAVHSLDDVARRMLLEVVRRLSLEGRMVYLVDPAAVIPDPDPGEGGQLTVVTSAKDLTGG
jgi:glutaminase